MCIHSQNFAKQNNRKVKSFNHIDGPTIQSNHVHPWVLQLNNVQHLDQYLYHGVRNTLVNPKSTEFANFWHDHFISAFVMSKFGQTFVDQLICSGRRARDSKKENQQKLEREPVNKNLRRHDMKKSHNKKTNVNLESLEAICHCLLTE